MKANNMNDIPMNEETLKIVKLEQAMDDVKKPKSTIAKKFIFAVYLQPTTVISSTKILRKGQGTVNFHANASTPLTGRAHSVISTPKTRNVNNDEASNDMMKTPIAAAAYTPLPSTPSTTMSTTVKATPAPTPIEAVKEQSIANDSDSDDSNHILD